MVAAQVDDDGVGVEVALAVFLHFRRHRTIGGALCLVGMEGRHRRPVQLCARLAQADRQQGAVEAGVAPLGALLAELAPVEGMGKLLAVEAEAALHRARHKGIAEVDEGVAGIGPPVPALFAEAIESEEVTLREFGHVPAVAIVDARAGRRSARFRRVDQHAVPAPYSDEAGPEPLLFHRTAQHRDARVAVVDLGTEAFQSSLVAAAVSHLCRQRQAFGTCLGQIGYKARIGRIVGAGMVVQRDLVGRLDVGDGGQAPLIASLWGGGCGHRAAGQHHGCDAGTAYEIEHIVYTS